MTRLKQLWSRDNAAHGYSISLRVSRRYNEVK